MSGLDALISDLSPAQLAGQLLVVGFDGGAAPDALTRAFAAGERAGVVIFRRNLGPGPLGITALQELCAQLGASAPAELPPLIAIDEEGGRVARLEPPALRVPAMRRLANTGDAALVERVAASVARELRCLGVTMNFAPVVDVDTNPDNPIIGDRAFASDPGGVEAFAAAYLRGMRAGGIASCLKHYPGHGDTLLDSHLALPTVAHPAERLEAVELAPFRALAAQADSIMTAHVVYPALDAERPATLSSRIATEILRGQIGFGGVLFSDDLEMRAIHGHSSFGDSALAALRAGCDLLLVCSRRDAQDEVHAAVARAISEDAAFAARCREAAARGLALRRAFPPQPGTLQDFEALQARELIPLAAELASRVG